MEQQSLPREGWCVLEAGGAGRSGSGGKSCPASPEPQRQVQSRTMGRSDWLVRPERHSGSCAQSGQPGSECCDGTARKWVLDSQVS